MTSKQLPVQVANKVRCPVCLRDDFENNGTHNGIRYMKCNVCCDPDTSAPTTFKVILTDPLKPKGAMQSERYVKGLPPEMLQDYYPPIPLG